MSKDNGTRFRREAAPVAVSRLSQSQQKARGFIVKQIEAAADLIKVKKLEEHTTYNKGTIHIDYNRRNQVIFVSGSRGSGKTSVVLSIIDEFLHPNEFLDINRKNDSSEAIHRVRENVVWLELLDLDPIPENANLLLALLARVHNVLHNSSVSSQSNKNFKDASQKLRQIQNDLALAWDDNLESRKSNIDVDQYTTELKRVEMARLSLNRQLSDVLKAVAKAIEKPGCLFVLVVDDFDLSPLKAVELTHYLRMFSVPELCTIMLGDLGIAEEMFSLVLTGQLNEMSPGHQGLLFTSPTEISANALRKLLPLNQRITIENFQIEEALKFGPDQTMERNSNSGSGNSSKSLLNDLKREIRQTLDVTNSEEDVDLIRLLQNFSEDKSEQNHADPQKYSNNYSANSLMELLNDIKFKIITGPLATSDGRMTDTKFGEFLLVSSKLSQSGNGQSQKYIYHAVQILAAPPRHIADLWLNLNQLKLESANNGHESSEDMNRVDDVEDTKNNADRLLDLSAHMLMQALNEDSELSAPGRYVLRKSFYKDPLQNEWELDVSNIYLQGRTGSDLSLTKIEPRLYDRGAVHCRVVVRRFLRWIIQPKILREDDYIPANRLMSQDNLQEEGNSQKIRLGHALSTYSTSAYILFHDLLRLTNRGSVIGRIEDQKMTQRAYTEWPVGMQKSFIVPWFLSTWETLREFSQLTEIWNTGKVIAREIRYHETEKMNDTAITQFMAYVWIVGGVSILERQPVDSNESECDSKNDVLHYLKETNKIISNQEAPNTIIELLFDTDDPSRKEHWQDLSRRIKEMANVLIDRRKKHADDLSTILLRNWFVNLAYLLCPETGVDIGILIDLKLIEHSPPKTKDDFADWSLNKDNAVWELWSEPFIAREIRRHRAERLGKFAYSERGLRLVSPHVYNEIVKSIKPISEKKEDVSIHPLNNLMNSLSRRDKDSDPKEPSLFSPSRIDLLAVLLNKTDREYKKNPGADPEIFESFFPGEIKLESGKDAE